MCFIFTYQRPRKVGAKFTGSGMAPDEHSQLNLALDYDGKRDRWNGYDPEDHHRIVEEYSKVDQVSFTCSLGPYPTVQPVEQHTIPDEESSARLEIFGENVDRNFTNVLIFT